MFMKIFRRREEECSIVFEASVCPACRISSVVGCRGTAS
jgi:hypothetical protein